MAAYLSMMLALGSIDPVVPNEILIILLILGVVIFVWDVFDRRSTKIRTSGGLSEKSEVVALRGSSYLPAKEYYSAKLNLSSRPHGLIREEGVIIPVDVNPLSRKIKDRHVIQMLAHLRLIEEAEGVKPPYGMLVMGPEARPVKIKNSEEKQAWLDRVLQEMNAIIAGAEAVADPVFYKCRSCDVRELCSFSVYDESRDRHPRQKHDSEPDEES